MTNSCFWPCKGGAWRDRAVAAAMLAELMLLWGGWYVLLWVLR